MKKLLSVLLLCALAFSACAPKSGGASASVIAAEPPAVNISLNPESDEPLYEVSEGSYVASSRLAVSQLYLKEKISDEAYNFLCDIIAFQSNYSSGSLLEFKLFYDAEQYKADKKMWLDFTVAPAEDTYSIPGKYRFYLLDEDVPRVENREEKPDNKEPKSGLSEALNNYFAATGCYEVPKGTVLSNYEAKEADLLYTVNAIEEKDGAEIITVQFYADITRAVRSHLVTYTVLNSGEMLGYEINYASFSPLNARRNADSIYSQMTTDVADINELKKLNPLMAALISCDIDALKENHPYKDNPEMLNAADVFQSAASEIKIDEWNEMAVLKLNISKSDNINYPSGEGYYTVSTGMSGTLRSIDAENVKYTPAQRALSSFIECMDTENYTLNNIGSSERLADYILHMLYKHYPSRSGFTAQEAADYAEKYLSVSGFTVPEMYKQPDGSYMLLPRGGYTVPYTIEQSAGREFPEITVQFYADDARLVRSDKILYKLQLLDGEYKLLSAEVLEDSPYTISRWGV